MMSPQRRETKSARFQSGAVRVDISAKAVFRFTGSIVLGPCHSVGGKWRAAAGGVTVLCRLPHEMQMAPTSLRSVSLDISFSRTAIEPVTTGP